MRLRSLSNALIVATTAGSLVAAAPNAHIHHHDHHEHVEKREPNTATADLPGPTAVIYELNGKVLNEIEVCQGIKDGLLQWAEGFESSIDCSSIEDSIANPTTLATYAAPTSTPEDFQFELAKKDELATVGTTATDSTPAGQGLDTEFPDGTIDCSSFPSDYGPISVDWVQLGGWSGIQYVTISDDVASNIVTATAGQGCTEGAMCSYACPAGYQKSQWPSTQGSTGQSIGGLQCTNGKLTLTNPSLSKNLCIQGTGATVVQNKLSENAAICRTDYPGTEAEVVPLNTEPSTTNDLTCPDAKTYYTHQGSATSAQYYINNQGVAVSSACTWGTDGTDMGNWAPSYLGVGQDPSGKTWLSISSTAQNNPSNYRALNFTVEIEGNISEPCKLSNGQYCSGANYDVCNESGCTTQLLDGTGTFVLHN